MTVYVNSQKYFESEDVVTFLKKRQLIAQYKKVKQYILSGSYSATKFSERQPKGTGIYYFRINKQFRAWGKFDKKGNFVVGKIDNHQ